MVRRVRQEGRAMNRREIFKGAIGGAAAASLAADKQMLATIPQVYQVPAGNNPPPPQPIPDIFDSPFAIKSAMMANAEAEGRRMEAELDRQRAQLFRMKSVSEAYRDFKLLEFRKQQTAIWARVEEARKFIFG